MPENGSFKILADLSYDRIQLVAIRIDLCTSITLLNAIRQHRLRAAQFRNEKMQYD